jgi:uncharacterized protein YegL
MTEFTPEFEENAEPRCACVLLLDTSGSMVGAKIEALNQGLRTFHEQLMSDSTARRRVELAVVTFNSTVEVIHDFSSPENFSPPALTATGTTHTGQAIVMALDMLEARKATYKANSILYYRPWIFMITDGEPQGEPASDVQDAIQRLHKAATDKKATFFAVGVEGADREMLRAISPPDRVPVMLTGLDFRTLFEWLSRSLSKVGASKVSDEQVALPPVGWGTA